MTPLERAKARTLKDIFPVVRAVWYRHATRCRASEQRVVQRYAGQDEARSEECEAFIEWAVSDKDALEEYLAKRSPSSAAEIAIRAGKRLCPAAEKIVLDKAKDKPRLLEYCSDFGILLGDMSKVTMKAAFDENSWREKRYIKKIENTKKKIREFLEQMVANGQVESGITVGELITSL